jgi:hypothetical protein
MTQQVDFTKFRKGSRPNGRPIDYCTKCGRKGAKTVYRDGDIRYVHTGYIQFGFLTVQESCTIVATDQKSRTGSK